MFQVGNIKIGFIHDREQRKTLCHIDDGGVNFIGIAECHVTDNYVKAVGRKLALKRALERGGFLREDRRRIWHQYFKVHSSEGINPLEMESKSDQIK